MKKKSVNAVIVLSLSVFLLKGCASTQSKIIGNDNSSKSESAFSISPTVTPVITNADPTNKTNKIEDAGEITNCTPNKIYKGETVTVTLKTPHGIYSAIRRLKDDKWFFLYGDKNNNPVWNDKSFTELSEIKIDTSSAYNSTNVDVGETSEKIFNKTGAYRIMVSNEDFGQDDPPWTGMCEVFYVNEKRPEEK